MATMENVTFSYENDVDNDDGRKEDMPLAVFKHTMPGAMLKETINAIHLV